MDETVLITGCSSGIGRETALSFLADGWEVYATARNPADIETLGEKGCHISTLNVTDDDHVERVIDEIIDEHGHLDCLVNNAGYAQPGPVEDVPIEQVHAQFDVNVYGPLRLARAALSHMRERGKGTIINVSSAVGRVAVPGMGIYSGSKFALEGVSDSLRGEVAEYDVDVVLVEPGPVDTEFYDRASDEVEGVERRAVTNASTRCTVTGRPSTAACRVRSTPRRSPTQSSTPRTSNTRTPGIRSERSLT